MSADTPTVIGATKVAGRHRKTCGGGRMAATTAGVRTAPFGLVTGGAAGALAGRAMDTRGDRATGTVLGAAAGALLGREFQKSLSCR